MSTFAPDTKLPNLSDARFAIVVADWNGHITHRLADSATKLLHDNKQEVATYHVPGAVELTFAASQLIETEAFDAIIVIGCVIRGGTPHFEYVCQSVTQGITALNADCDTPVIFGVLTVDTEQDALDRAGGSAGDKGAEAAATAMQMVAFKRHVTDTLL